MFSNSIDMSSLKEVYGDDFHAQAYQSRVDHILNIITNNISHREFVYQLDNCDPLWNGDHLGKEIIKRICDRVQEMNSQLTVRHIDLEHPEQRKMLPFLIKNTSIEYFYIIDKELLRCYIIFITPAQMGAY
jgi:hypothetical protein